MRLGHDSGEYYNVRGELWAATGLAPHSGVLCLACLERRTKHRLAPEDFCGIWPEREARERHLRARADV